MSEHLKQIQNWAERALAAKWSVETLAKNCGVSERILQRFFKQNMGKSPKAWLLELRLQQADKLLKDGLSVKEAAGELGYKYQNSLTNAYTKHWGYSPTTPPVKICEMIGTGALRRPRCRTECQARQAKRQFQPESRN